MPDELEGGKRHCEYDSWIGEATLTCHLIGFASSESFERSFATITRTSLESTSCWEL